METGGCGGSLGVDAARGMLGELLDAVASGGAQVITRRRVRAVLVPLTRLGEVESGSAAVWTFTAARKELGALVAAAAGGVPQVITRNREPAAALVPVRDLTLLGEAVEGLDTGGSAPHLSTGLPGLDAATGGLAAGKLVVVAAPPGAGGSLLVAGVARAAALGTGLTVLYAASGLSRTDVAARIVAAEAGVDYRRMRAGLLDPADTAAEQATMTRLRKATPLHIDDGAGLSAEVIAGTAREVPSLALVVVDRLQHTPDPQLPLSGPAAVEATAVLARVARELHVPVLAAYDTADPQALSLLAADAVWTLGTDGTVTVAERDFGTVGTVRLRPDLGRARFLDGSAISAPGSESAPQEAPAGEDTPATPQPAPAPEPVSGSAPVESPVAAAARTAAYREQAARRGKSAARTRTDTTQMIARAVRAELDRAEGDADAAAEALIKRAIPDVMDLWRETRAGARYEHTAYPALPDILHKPRKSDPDLIWEARPSWRHPGYRRTPDGTLPVTPLDVNAAYLSALKAWLPIGKLEHSTTGEHDRKRAGIHLITPPAWHHPDLPNPLGDREETGPLWITESTLRLLLRLAGPKHDLCDAPVVHESWTSGATENLCDDLRVLLATARQDAIDTEDDLTLAYIKAMYSKFVSTLGESVHNREIVRPDWMHIIRAQAAANLWSRAYKAHQAGLTLISVMGTDELHLTGGDWRTVFTSGRALTDMKIKTDSTTGEPMYYSVEGTG